MFNQSIFARGALTMSLAGAAALAVPAIAGANVVVTRPPAKIVQPAAAQVPGKRAFSVRRPRVNSSTLVVLGGGATLPAIAYSGAAQALGTQPATAPLATSVLGYFGANAPLPVNAGSNTSYLASYCQTASGPGRGVISGEYGVLEGPYGSYGNCPPNLSSYSFAKNHTAGAYNGFDPSGVTDTADFAGSDAPEPLSDYLALSANVPARGEVVQVPTIAGSVAIAYHNTDVAGTSIRLTIPEICKIADGEITNWDLIPKAADSSVAITSKVSPILPVSATNPGFPSKPIYFVFRSDNSGTTFSFTNFLSAATYTTNSKTGVTTVTPSHCTLAGETWGLNQSFAAAVPQPSGASLTNFDGENGNPAIISKVDATDGAMGYVEAANEQAADTTSTGLASVYSALNTADLKSPIADLPTAAKYITTFKKDYTVNFTCGNAGVTVGSGNGGTGVASGCTTVQGRLAPVAGSSPTSYTPDLTAIPAADLIKAGCVGVVDPSVYMAPAGGYPIVAVSNLEFYESGNGVYIQGLRYLAELLPNLTTNTAVASPKYTPWTGTFPLTTVDKEGTAVGTTGFSTLGIAATYYNNATIGIAPTCIN